MELEKQILNCNLHSYLEIEELFNITIQHLDYIIGLLK